MSGLGIKLIPKDKQDINNFRNVFDRKSFNFDDYVGKIVYSNLSYPGKHIYHPYYVNIDEKKEANGKLIYEKVKQKDGSYKLEPPLFCLQDLNFDDIIVFVDYKDV
jgi:hypothetical protein